MSIIKFISSIFSISSSSNKKSNQITTGSVNSGNLTQYSNDRVSCVGALDFKSNLGFNGSLYTLGSGRCGDGFAYGRNYY